MTAQSNSPATTRRCTAAARLAVLFCSWLATAAPVAFGQEAPELVRQGDDRLRAGEIESALAAYRSAAAIAPDDAAVRYKLAGALLAAGHNREAVEQYKRVIGQQSENADAFAGLGLAYLHLGEYALSRAALEEARSRDDGLAPDIDRILAWIERRMPDS